MVYRILFLQIVLAWPLCAETLKRVESTGFGAIVGGDRAAAFEEAKKNALRQAVEEAVGVLLSSHSRVENFALIEDNIYTRTEGYVRVYEVLEEYLLDESTLAVTLESTVELGVIQDRIDGLEVLIESAGNPYIVILESTRAKRRVGIHLREALAKISKHLNLMVVPELSHVESSAEAARIGKENGADIVLLSLIHI